MELMIRSWEDLQLGSFSYSGYGLVCCLKWWPWGGSGFSPSFFKYVRHSNVTWLNYEVKFTLSAGQTQGRTPEKNNHSSNPLTTCPLASDVAIRLNVCELLKWSGWRAAEEDIFQCPIILSNHHVHCVCGVSEVEGDPGPTVRCHARRQWMDNGHPSIFHASLSRGLKPTTMSVSEQLYASSWLIHQPDLICNPDWWPEERGVGFKGEDSFKIWNLKLSKM